VRLLIKSTMAANSAALSIPDQATVEYAVDLSAKVLTVTVDGVPHELPIDEYSLKFQQAI
jgi:hypothetical protein